MTVDTPTADVVTGRPHKFSPSLFRSFSSKLARRCVSLCLFVAFLVLCLCIKLFMDENLF